MKERSLSARGLARLLAGPDANNQLVENWRRNIIRYRKEAAEPEEETASLMEAALGKKRGYFPRVDRGSGGSLFAQRLADLEGRVKYLEEQVEARLASKQVQGARRAKPSVGP
jgi:hypothetical protein